MTKLEQCVRLVMALSEENGQITITFVRGAFVVRAEADRGLTESIGTTLDEAVEATHISLKEHTNNLRELFAAFEAE